MPITLRPITAHDFPRAAELLNLGASDPITAETLREWERNAVEGRIRWRVAAVDERGLIAGYGHAIRDHWAPEGLFWLYVAVDLAWRRQGIGSQLFDAVLDYAREHRATHYRDEIREGVPAVLAFAERCGFRIERHLFESALDVAAFDEGPFAGAVEEVEASGIRLFSMADLGDTPEVRRRLWELNERVGLDVPGDDGKIRPFDAFEKQVCLASWYRPDGQIIAADGDRWIGVSAVGYFPHTNAMWSMITGVDRAYRGRGIALALKLLTIRCAKRYGVASIRAHNDSENAPMLAINRKLGFQPQPGVYRMLRETP